MWNKFDLREVSLGKGMLFFERCTNAVDSELLEGCQCEKSASFVEGPNGESKPEGMHNVGR